MSTRKSFPNSIIPLPDEPGITSHGLMVNKALAEDQDSELNILFSLAMPPDKQKELEQRVARGEVVSPKELKTTYVADQKDTVALVSWLEGQGFKDVRVSPNGTGVYAKAPASQIEKSLQVNMVRVTRDGITYTAAKDAPSLPSEVANSVQTIAGLQPFRQLNKRRLLPATRVAVRKAAGPSAQVQNAPPYLVNEILGAYNAAGLGVTGAGQTIAILIDTFPADADLSAFWSMNGITVNPAQIQKINVNGGTLPAPTGEETLDAEWASGIAPGAATRIYASGSLAWVDLDQALDAILDDLDSIPSLRQLSISLGLGETFIPGGESGEASTEGQKFLRFAAAGVNVFVSSGDAGSNPDASGHHPTGPTQVEYPSSDPNVIGVGGTSLSLAADGSVESETGWVNGGGGISSFFQRPEWQTGNGVDSGSQRLVPDVSLTADPNKGAMIVLHGVQQGVGGTSWSAPVWAGFCALLNEARTKAGKSPLPFLNSHLYQLNGTPAFRDITSGSNGAFSAGDGYDMVTGIGVPDLTELTTALLQLP